MVLAKQNQTVRMHFTVFDTDGTTPLTGQAGSCTTYLAEDGATASESVTVSEIGTTGHYFASFTPLNIGTYDLEVQCPDDRVVGDSFEVQTNDLDDLATDIDDVKGTGFVKDIHSLTDIEAFVDDIPTIPTDVNTELTSQHGAGSWQSASAQDWSSTEREQIRSALGIDGTKTTAVGGQLQTIATNLDRALGLMFENHVMDTIVYDGTGNMTSAKIYIYDSKANAQSNDHVTGLVAEYTITGTVTGNQLTKLEIVKE